MFNYQLIRRKNLIYIFAIFLGIVEKMSQILLFILPIKAIAIVSKGVISPQLTKLSSIVNIEITSNKEQFIFLTVGLILLVFHVSFTNFLKIKVINNIKIRKFRNLSCNRENLNEEEIKNNLQKIDEFIIIRTTLIYSLILLLLLFYYDYQITLIIISSCVINYIITKRLKRIDDLSNKEITIENKNPDFYIKKIQKDFRLTSFIRPVLNTTIMFCIMTSIFIRENASISIILIFIIRNAMGQINDLVFRVSGNKEFIKTLFSKNEFKNLLKKVSF